ncbi:MAG: Lrp/AsnC family transcriptional regulator [archaeon]|nr:Lrp/AsnC family transcriptional regulator [archaeon]
MSTRRSFFDDIDKKILISLQNDCRTPLGKLAEKLEIPKSTLHYRIKRLEEENIIEGYYAKVNTSKLGGDFHTIIHLRAKHGPGYQKKIGNLLKKIPGVWAVYYVLGEEDFIIHCRAENREDFMIKFQNIIDSSDIDRSRTAMIAEIIKEDQRVFFNV